MLKLRMALMAMLLVFLTPASHFNDSLSVDQNPLAIEQNEAVATAQVLDPRAQILQAYLARYNSPLQNHSQDFVDAADKYHLDWKLVPAISGVESTFGKHIPGGYNGWGWGVYGDQALGFDSWTDGIYTVTEGLKTRYVDRGLTEPLAMNKVYAASPTWGTHVNFFLNDLNRFEKEYKRVHGATGQLAYLNMSANPAGTSAQLASQLP